MQWQESYKIFSEVLNKSIENCNLKKVQEITDIISKTDRNLFFCGIGKNAYIARHIVATYNSVSIQSFFIDPVDAIHGDMGVLKDGDVLIILTKSGNTQEIVSFIDRIDKDITKILIHSNKNNLLSEKMDHNIFLEVQKEIDPFNIVPTASLVVYLSFLQAIGIQVLEERNFKLQEFFQNHPGGNIGSLGRKKNG